jgi:hypothetical protein
MACGLYEGLLVFGVLAAASLAYGLVLRPSGDTNWGMAHKLYLLCVLAAYFTWFWSRGETLAMGTWHLRLRMAKGAGPVRPARALLRFALSLMWFLPGLLTLHLSGLDGERGAWWMVMGANVVGYALLTRLHPSRQYLHDLLAGTEMVFVPGRKMKQRGEG